MNTPQISVACTDNLFLFSFPPLINHTFCCGAAVVWKTRNQALISIFLAHLF